MQIPPAEQSINQMVAGFHEIAAGYQSAGVQLGKVITPPPEIQVAWNDIILTKEQIYINEILLTKHKRKIKGKIKIDDATGEIHTRTIPKRGGAGKPAYAAHDHKIDDDYSADMQGEFEAEIETLDFGLKAGDIVSLEPVEGGQSFIITGKLIYLANWSESGENNRSFI